jgi:predicted nuclease with RNAse H fold
MESAPTVIGIDVGGSRKGFHAVALTAGAYAAQLATPHERELAHWCRSVIGASLIAIDAPCRWSTDGKARPCELALNAAGIRCFASPSREAALAHPSDYYGWMLQGEALYRELEASHPLLPGLAPRGAACFETFPHAITWQLRGGQASAAHKRSQRSELLQQAGIDTASLTSIDWIDAALCALSAHHLASGLPCRAYGEPASGLIVVPEPTVSTTGIPFPAGPLHAPPELLAAIQARRPKGRLLHLDRMLLHSPAIAQGWTTLFTTIRHQLSLPAKLRELCILAIAVSNQASYQWLQHEPEFLQAGGTGEQLQALRATLADAEHNASLFDATERAALTLTPGDDPAGGRAAGHPPACSRPAGQRPAAD